MLIERVEAGPVTIIVVQGVIRLGESAKTFSSFLREVLEEGSKPVIVELEGIDHVDSTGLGELVGYLQRFEEQGRRMAFVNPARRLRKLLELTRLDQVVPIYPDRASAIAAVTGA
jgi:anti-sigma B factor antagonist